MKDFKHIISQQRDGLEISDADFQRFIDAIANGDVTDAQISAYVMAVYLCGLTGSEMVLMTKILRDSGKVLEWPGVSGPILTKYSTGGVADYSSLVLAPIFAEAGGNMPMIGHRSSEFSACNITKLELIEGFSAVQSIEKIQEIVKEVGIVFAEVPKELSPAETKINEIREHIGARKSIHLITTSLLAQKLAVGAEGLIVDVKTGNAAFTNSFGTAKKLATKISAVARACDLKSSAFISDMSQPLSSSIGPGLELKEAVAFLTNKKRHRRMFEFVEQVGAEMLTLSKVSPDIMKAESTINYIIDSGQGAQRLGKMISVMGGPSDFIENIDKYIKPAAIVKPVYADFEGVVHSVDNSSLFRLVKALDSNVSLGHGGLSDVAMIGDPVNAHRPLAVVHANSEEMYEDAATLIKACITVEIATVQPSQTVLDLMKSTNF